MANIFLSEFRRSIIYGIVCCIIILYASGCGPKNKEQQTPYIPSKSAQNLYANSEQEFKIGDYEKAYYNYKKAVAIDPGVANVSYLNNVIYEWVISKSDPEDIPLLTAQKQVFLNHRNLEFREKLLSLAVDRERGVIFAFGIGVLDDTGPLPAQQHLLASKAALTDSQLWIARIALWARDGISCPFDVSTSIASFEKLKEIRVGNIIYVIKLKAPIDCLG